LKEARSEGFPQRSRVAVQRVQAEAAEDFERKLKGSVEAGFLWMRFEVGKAVVSCAVL